MVSQLTKEKCYVSGAISFYIKTKGPIAGIEYAEKLFEESCEKVRKLNYTPVDPMKINKGKNMSYIGYLIRDFIELNKCKAIYMRKDWKQSTGSHIELLAAQEQGLKVIFEE